MGVARVTSGRQRRGDGRDNGYLSKLVAKLAMDFYKDRLSEVEAEEMFGPDWSTQLLRGQVVEFRKGSTVECDKWRVKWSDNDFRDMKSPEILLAIAAEDKSPRARAAASLPVLAPTSQRGRRAAAQSSLAALVAEDSRNDFDTST